MLLVYNLEGNVGQLRTQKERLPQKLVQCHQRQRTCERHLLLFFFTLSRRVLTFKGAEPIVVTSSKHIRELSKGISAQKPEGRKIKTRRRRQMLYP